MSTYVYVKRNTLHSYTYPTEDTPYIQFKYVSMGVAYNMVHGQQIGWERAKKGDYEKWVNNRKKFKYK